MKKLFIGLFIHISICSLNALHADDANLKLWYNSPADATVADNPNGWKDDAEWLKAMPLGNGSLGAVVFGDVGYERIQLNEETMWSGSPQECDNPEAAKHLDEIKDLLKNGKYREATALTNRTQVCTGKGSGGGNGSTVPFGCFQTLGDLWLDFENKGNYTDYSRELDLSTATARVSYTQDGIKFNREIFVSYPDQVMVVRLSADKKKSYSFTCRMSRPERFTTYTENGQLIMTGALSDGKGGDGLKYMARLKAIAVNGDVTYTDSSIKISNADEVVLLLSASTDYKLEYPHYKGRDYKKITSEAISKASETSYKKLHKRHVDDYSQYFERTDFKLSDSSYSLPTDSLVMMARKGVVDNHLYELMFQYGRYLLISSSRPGTMPANLQGIWANKIQTPWNGDYHTDVNVEMNYWPSEVTNLSEMHLPLFDLIESLVKPGSRTAKI